MALTESRLYNLSQLKAIASGSQEFVTKMITMFLEVTPALVDRVENGIKLEDREDVRSASHKMKPSLDIMGIESFYTVIRSIEQNVKKESNLDDVHQLSRTLHSTLEKVYKELRENELSAI